MSLQAIANYFKCKKSTVNTKLKNMGIVKREQNNITSKTKLKLPDKEIKYYYESGISASEIAEAFNCSNTTIYNRLRAMKVTIRTLEEIRTLNLPDEKIRELYESKIPSSEIAELYGCSINAIATRLKQMNILRPPGLINIRDLPDDEIKNMYESGESVMKISEQIECSTSLIYKTLKKMEVNVGTIEATIDGMPTYDRFAEELSVTDKVRPDPSDNALLQVACKKCDKFFNPSYTATRNRISAISKDGHGESNFYCSDECKDACSIFNKHLFQADHPNKPQLVERPYQSEWSEMVIELAEFKCEKCGSTDNLTAHHIQPFKTHPHLQADLDNGICLCKVCHIEVHKLDGCKTGQLSNLICD